MLSIGKHLSLRIVLIFSLKGVASKTRKTYSAPYFITGRIHDQSPTANIIIQDVMCKKS